MKLKCINCLSLSSNASEVRNNFVKHGVFYRKSDRKKVQRFLCKSCGNTLSIATFSKCYWQKKRHLNHKVARLMVAGVSQREGHKVLKINRKTFVRKFLFMGKLALDKLHRTNLKYAKSRHIQFDDLETFEHTKCKPLSVTLAVENKTRRVLHFAVSQMPAKGLLAAKSYKKYGLRKDCRGQGRANLLNKIKDLVEPNCRIESDDNPHYPQDVKKHFPRAQHKTYKGRKGAITGQGELKKIGYDPLFSLNHTCAVLRARMNRLFRRTWCTTKKPERLNLHMALTALHHNLNLKSSA